MPNDKACRMGGHSSGTGGACGARLARPSERSVDSESAVHGGSRRVRIDAGGQTRVARRRRLPYTLLALSSASARSTSRRAGASRTRPGGQGASLAALPRALMNYQRCVQGVCSVAAMRVARRQARRLAAAVPIPRQWRAHVEARQPAPGRGSRRRPPPRVPAPRRSSAPQVRNEAGARGGMPVCGNGPQQACQVA